MNQATPICDEAAELLAQARACAQTTNSTPEPSPANETTAPETLLESAVRARCAALELDARLGLLVEAVEREGDDSLGAAFAKSVEFVPAEDAGATSGPTLQGVYRQIKDCEQRAEVIAAFSSMLSDYFEMQDCGAVARPESVLLQELKGHVEQMHCAVMEAALDARWIAERPSRA